MCEYRFSGKAKSRCGSSEATNFIEDGFKKERPRQVRWAMFYLGKNGFTESIPLLMKHLDYRYTTSRVVTEDYPALKALIWLKQPAADAARKAISTETNELRLELLCRLVLAAEGEVQGDASLRESIANAKDQVQRGRLQQAFERAQRTYDGTVTTET